MTDGPYSGWKTMADGSRVTMTSDEARALWEVSEAATAKLVADMPTEQDALREMNRAYHRLRDFGWNSIIYCPKDGSMFDAIEAGSTGVHRCNYQGKWPHGSWWIYADGDVGPSRPILFRLDPEAEEARKKKMADAAEKFRADAALDESPAREPGGAVGGGQGV